ncbi:MAG: HAD family hydrolase [Actinomycetota bacterium]
MSPQRTPGVVILDVDGTLVDTNYHHALAWYRAFRAHHLTPALWRIHRHMGMGGDQLVGAVAGAEVERRSGDAIRKAESQCYQELIGEVQPLAGARELLQDLRAAGWTTVLASSAKTPELDRYLDLLKARELVDAWTDSSDVQATKPEPDLIHAALSKVGKSSGLMVGDSIFDCEAAGRAGIHTVALLTGGFSREELQQAGAVAVCANLAELRGELGLAGSG